MAYTGRELIAARCAKFFKDGDFVNLGIGVPTMCINYLPEGVDLWLETETGACGTGPTPPIDKWDTDYADAGSNPITLLPPAAPRRWQHPQPTDAQGVAAPHPQPCLIPKG